MHLFFSVGEPSGDLHGANLIRELRRRVPEVRCVGYGGPRMEAAGFELHTDLTKQAVMWVSRVLANFQYFWGLIQQADRYFAEQAPDAVILIDYPGLNWWIARRAKARGIPVVYYGTPQLWAWAPWRVRKMRRLVDHALCKLPFEESWFRQRGVNATHVGHPYFDELATRTLDQEFVQALEQRDCKVITILPGSRDQEVEHNLPMLLRAAARIQQARPDTIFCVASFSASQADVARDLLREHGLAAEVHVGRTPELIEAAHSCIACSGSVSLELLFHRKPAVIVYAISRGAFLLQSIFRTARHITLTNLLAEHHHTPIPVPEHLTWRDESDQIAAQVVHWIEDEEAYAANCRLLSQLCAQDAVPGASERAADYMLRQLNSPGGTPRAA
ncbi:MAG: lipid-A-disaccharide synthase [Planctomycetota bacterium]